MDVFVVLCFEFKHITPKKGKVNLFEGFSLSFWVIGIILIL